MRRRTVLAAMAMAAAVLAGAVLVCAVVMPPAALAEVESGPVLVVGDSLEVGSGPHLRRALRSAPVTIDARTGRRSAEGIAVLRRRLRPAHRVVVFDLGTNDDPSKARAFARTLAAARGLVGERCLVVSTLTRPPVNGVSVARMNRTVREFFEADPNARLADWQAAVRTSPDLLASDDVHATPAGYAARARLVAGAIEECFAGAEPPSEPSRAVPEPDPPPARKPRPRRSIRDVLVLARYDLVASWVGRVTDRVILAGRDMSAVFGPQPPEVELGTPRRSR